jgi:molybdopterin synthase sulfur carrier subunit
MEWKLFADLAEAAGGRTVTVSAGPGDTVGDALEDLLEDRPDLRDRVMEDGELADHINLLRNGQNVIHEDGLETELEDDDELALFPPVSGGSAVHDERSRRQSSRR